MVRKLKSEMTRQEQIELQNNKIRHIIPYIMKVPFYERKFSKEKIDINNAKDIFEIQKVPFTTKEELRITGPMERTSLQYKNIIYFFSSTGTTGQPTIYPWSKKDDLVLNEVSGRFMKNIGIGAGDISLIVAPFGMPIMWYCMINQYLTVNAGVVPLGITPSDQLIKALNYFPVTSITTIPTTGTLLYDFIRKKNISVNTERLKHFHCGGDYLSNARRKRIEKYWSVDCYNFYGLSEIFGPIAGECEKKNGLHFATDYVLIEVINPITKQPVSEGETGIAVFTTLWEKAAPLIRYWSDDYVIIKWEKCECGLTYPRIDFKGRVIDSIKINKNLIFAKDIEEVLLSIEGVSNEWKMIVGGRSENPIVKIYLEEHSSDISKEIVKNRLSNLIGKNLDLEIIFKTYSPNKEIKPLRIIDRRNNEEYI